MEELSGVSKFGPRTSVDGSTEERLQSGVKPGDVRSNERLRVCIFALVQSLGQTNLYMVVTCPHGRGYK